MQSLTIAAFVLINFSLCCVSYGVFDGNVEYVDQEIDPKISNMH